MSRLSPKEQIRRAKRKMRLEEQRSERRSFFTALRKRGLPLPEPEYRFHPTRRFRADYCWPEKRVILEVQGGIFGRGAKCPCCGRRRVGAHSSIKDQLRDIERTSEAAAEGFRIVYCVPDKLCSTETIARIERALNHR